MVDMSRRIILHYHNARFFNLGSKSKRVEKRVLNTFMIDEPINSSFSTLATLFQLRRRLRMYNPNWGEIISLHLPLCFLPLPLELSDRTIHLLLGLIWSRVEVIGKITAYRSI